MTFSAPSRPELAASPRAHLQYRPEIDGLRALAVVPVVLFHLGLGLTGGYVGVDVFFVISGFLITSLIQADLEAGTFSLGQFWVRRIRRIFPAAVVTVLVTVALGLLLMLPADLRDLGDAVVAQALLGANFYFYATTGYFAAPADTQPLLHFWSLAVEEQFYLLLPPLLLLLANWSRRTVARVIGTIALASFAISVPGSFLWPEASFYLLPARAWELGVGALLALRRGHLPLEEKWKGWLGWSGIGLILAPVFLYSATTPFPGLTALPPCLGALLVIWSTQGRNGYLTRALSLRPIVFIGLISYSLYLWHWPVQVYSHYWLTGPSPAYARFVVLGFTLVLAWFSWRYVELPFRRRRALTSPRGWVHAAAAATAVLLVAGATLATNEGFPGRLPDEVVQYAAAYEDRPVAEEADVAVDEVQENDLPPLNPYAQGPPRVLLWGDSHARTVSPAIEAVCAELGIAGVRASRGATPPVLNWGDADAKTHNDAVLRWIKQHRPEIVILAARWQVALTRSEDEVRLLETVRAVTALGAEVWIMRQVPSLGQDVPRALARASILDRDSKGIGITVEQHAAFHAASNAMLTRVMDRVECVTLLDPLPYLSINGICVAEANGEPLYYDQHHLARAGAARLEPMFEQAFDDADHRRWN